MKKEEEKIINIDEDLDKKDKEDSILTSVASRFAAIEKPLPKEASMESILEMLGRIESELVTYRRERLYKTYMWIALFMLPILGLGYLIPEFLKNFK